MTNIRRGNTDNYKSRYYDEGNTDNVRKQKAFETNSGILYVPVILLIMFLLGYLAVGFFGKPDLIVSAILFFGSIFVLIMYSITSRAHYGHGFCK